MKRTYTVLAAVAAIALGANSAMALPVHLSVNTAQSNLTLTLAAIGGAATGAATANLSDDNANSPGEAPFATPLPGSLTSPAIDPLPSRPGLAPPFGTFTGGIDAEIENLFGTNPGLFRIRAGEVDLSDIALSISLGFLGAVNAASDPNNGLGVSLGSSGILSPDSTAGSNMSFYNPGGLQLNLDQGVITYNGSGPVGGLLGTGSFDFNSGPLSFAIPSAPGTVKVTTDNAKNVTVLIPINITTVVTTDPIDVAATLAGQIVLTGRAVPEPGTMVLFALGGIALVPAALRRFRKAA